jgi:hypothetical protein
VANDRHHTSVICRRSAGKIRLAKQTLKPGTVQAFFRVGVMTAGALAYEHPAAGRLLRRKLAQRLAGCHVMTSKGRQQGKTNHNYFQFDSAIAATILSIAARSAGGDGLWSVHMIENATVRPLAATT